jgi:hypothetical protein
MEDFFAFLEKTFARGLITRRSYAMILEGYNRFLRAFSRVIFPGDAGFYSKDALSFDLYFATVSFVWKTTRECRITKTHRLRHSVKTRSLGYNIRYRGAPEFYTTDFGVLVDHLSTCEAWQKGQAEYVSHVVTQKCIRKHEDVAPAPCA